MRTKLGYGRSRLLAFAIGWAACPIKAFSESRPMNEAAVLRTLISEQCCSDIRAPICQNDDGEEWASATALNE